MRKINDWQNYSLETLINYVEKYDQRPESIKRIMKAYNMANNAHKGVKRASGKPYITHPVAVANFLAIMRVDIDSICAGLLHDVVEDTEITKEDIKLEFGDDVAEIVDGVTKINKLEDIDPSTLSVSLDEKNPENLRMLNRKKIIDSLLYDPRIIIVKLADRLHNMLTIGYKTPIKQKSKAAETLELYVPLANKLGIYRIQQELEDASLKCIEPYIYNRLMIIREKIKDDCSPFLNTMLSEMVCEIDDNLKIIGHYDQSELDSRNKKDLLNETIILGDDASRTRIKHIYGIYEALSKMKPEEEKDTSEYIKRLLFDKESFEEIHDLRVIKLIMKDEDSCYSLIRYLHQKYGNVQNRFKDYIYSPKYNMYQSLHTTVSNDGKYVQFQIRTLEQEYRDTYGLAWELYKFEGEYTRERILDEFKKYPAYKKLLDIKENKEVYDLESYQSLIKKEILNTSEITVINADNGKSIAIRDDATIRDFAYLIGGPLGDHLVRATLNDKVYELEIQNGVVNLEKYPFSIRLREGDEISVEFDENIWCPAPNTDIVPKKKKRWSKTLKNEMKKPKE